MPRKVLVAGGAALLLALGACGGQGAETPQPRSGGTTPTLPKAASAADLVTSLNAGIQAKKTATVHTSVTSAGDGPHPETTRVSGLLRADGPDQVATKVESADSVTLALPEGGFVKETGDDLWQRFDLGAEDPASVVQTTLLRHLTTQAIPSQLHEAVRLGGKIDASTTEEVGKVQAVKYTITVDLAKVAEQATDVYLKNAMKNRTTKQGRTTAVHEIWVSAENVPLRWKWREEGNGKSDAVDAAYANWGAPVDLAAPPADKIEK